MNQRQKQEFRHFARILQRKFQKHAIIITVISCVVIFFIFYFLSSSESVQNQQIDQIIQDSEKKSNKNDQNDSRKEKKGVKINKCPVCANLGEDYGDSTENDLIITGVFGNEHKLDRFIRSLRSTGSLAKVVVVSNTSFKGKFMNKYYKCNIEFFIMQSTAETMSMYPHSLRYVGYQQYFDTLKKSNKTYDRVLHSDSFDVFFQKDPFNTNVSKNKLYFVMEDINIENSTWNSGWLTRAYNETVANELGKYNVSCSGTVIGGYRYFLTYLKVMLKHGPFWANGRHSLDQAYHNYLLHTGEFKRNGIDVEYFGCNSHILTMHYCSRYGKEVIRKKRIFGPKGKDAPAVVHQYPLFPESKTLIKELCP